MPSTDKIRAGVERIQDGEIHATTRVSQPVTKLLDVNVITKNVELARKTEPQIADVLAKRDKAIDKARSGPTLHPELVKQLVKDAEMHANEELDAVLARLTENSSLLAGQAEHYSHAKCLARAQFAGTRDGDAATRLAVTSRLSRLSSAALVEAARSAVASSDSATAGCIADEMNARTDLSSADSRALSREVKAELNLLIADVPSDAMKVQSLLNEYDLITRRARIASGRATRSVDKIAAGLLAREQGAIK